MKLPEPAPITRKVILTIEILMLVINIWTLFAFAGSFIVSLNNEVSVFELASIFLVFLFSPVLVFLSNFTAFRFQWNNARPVYSLFVLSVIVNIVLVHSWGMHSFPTQSVVFSIVTAAIAGATVIKITHLKKAHAILLCGKNLIDKKLLF